MKRHGNLWELIVDLDNIHLAHKNARKGKQTYGEVMAIDANPDKFCKEIRDMLISGTYTTSSYDMFIKNDRGKVREIYKLPYFPDRIVQHALMQILEPIWKSTLIADTYQSIKGRGVHKVLPKVVKAVQVDKVQFCLRLDIRKFYPSIDKCILKKVIRKKIKCTDTLLLLDDIINSSTKGLPIGNYISQYLGNLYLSALDHKLKEEEKVVHYYRYCDDIIILGMSKERLHTIRELIEAELLKIGLKLKCDYRVHPVSTGVDVLGYVVDYNKVKVRNNIKQNMLRNYSNKNAPSYDGILSHCDGFTLNKILKETNESIT